MDKTRIHDRERLARRVGGAADTSKHRQIRDRDPMPNEPEALIEWAKRNIQGEPADRQKRDIAKSDWNAAAKKPLPSGSDADDAMEEIDEFTTELPPHPRS